MVALSWAAPAPVAGSITVQIMPPLRPSPPSKLGKTPIKAGLLGFDLSLALTGLQLLSLHARHCPTKPLQSRHLQKTQSSYRGMSRKKQRECTICTSALSAGAYNTSLYVMVDLVKEGGRAPPTPPSLVWANYPSSSPENGNCHSVYSVDRNIDMPPFPIYFFSLVSFWERIRERRRR